VLAFTQVVQKILDTPQLLAEVGGSGGGLSGLGGGRNDEDERAAYCSYC
jgi:hypothetical protein